MEGSSMATQGKHQGGTSGGATADEDRRDYPRVPMRFEVRRVEKGGDFAPCEGDLSVGGFSCVGAGLSDVETVEVRFSLPGTPAPLQARGQVVRLSEGAQGPVAHVAFVNAPVTFELAVARFLEGRPPSGGR
jgi:PilZ domain